MRKNSKLFYVGKYYETLYTVGANYAKYIHTQDFVYQILTMVDL